MVEAGYTAKMTGLALGLVLLSALLHASWNLLAKRAVNPEVFVWSLNIVGSVAMAPLGIILFLLYPVPPSGYWFVLATVVLHMFYFSLLGRGYSRGDLSLVYPIARGIGPMLVPVFAVLLLGETVAGIAVVGILLILAGIYIVSWSGRFRLILSHPLALLRDGGVVYAVLTGLTTTAYTLVDKQGVDQVQPFLYWYLGSIGVGIGLTPYILAQYRMAPVKQEWRQNFWPIVVAGLLVFAAYGMVLTALSISQVSYIAPAREVGIVMGVLIGALVLKEPFASGRLLGSGFIVAGLVLIALSP